MRRGNGAAFGVGILLLALIAGGWWFRDDLAELLGRESEPTEVSPEAAAAAEAKLAGLKEGGEPVRLSQIEVSSRLRFRSPAWVQERVHEPAVEFSGDTARLSGTVATSELPSHPDLDRVRILLPDSSRLKITGRVAPLPSGRVALQIDRVEFAGIPVPERYYPTVLDRFGRRDEPGLAPSALALPLPEGVGSARIDQGYLVLTP